MRVTWAVLAAFVPLVASAQGNLETPDPETVYTGIGFVSGWHCTARKVELQVDQYPRILAPSGSSREDTRAVCGHADTGFGYTINYNDLPEGSHKLVAYADGAVFASTVFVTYNLRTRAAPLKPRGRAWVFESPAPGQKTEVLFSEATQNFNPLVVIPNPMLLSETQGRFSGLARMSSPSEVGVGESCSFAPPPFGDSPVEADIKVDASARTARLSLVFPDGRSCSVGGTLVQGPNGMGEMREASSDCLSLNNSVDVEVADSTTASSTPPRSRTSFNYALSVRLVASKPAPPFSFCRSEQYLSLMLWPKP